MTAQELRQIIRSTLQPVNLWSPDAEELLMATAANESHLGEYRHQINGPAIGIYQDEQSDYDDLVNNFAMKNQYKPLVENHTFQEVETNDPYATIICRLHYLRIPAPLPDRNDLNAIWDYYKVYYNSVFGAATEPEFVANYNRYVLGQP